MGFSKASDLALADFAKHLIHGNSGAGKTHLGGTAKDVAIGLCERQAIRTIRRVNPDAAIWLIESTEDLRNMLSELHMMHAEGNCPYTTCVLDSLTEIQGMLKKETLSKAGSERETLTQGEWGVIIDKCANVARAYRDLPMHVLVFTRSEESYPQEERFVRPSLSGKKLPNDIAGYFNAVGYIYKKMDQNGDLVHRVLFDGTEGFLTKGDPDLDAVEIPHWPSWIRKIYGPDALGAATDEEFEEAQKGGKRELRVDGKTRTEAAQVPGEAKAQAKPKKAKDSKNDNQETQQQAG